MSEEGVDDSVAADQRFVGRDRFSSVGDRVTLAVVAVALLGFGLRVVGLDARPFHWDEARVGYWTLRYLDTGGFQYRPVAGGPLLYHLNRITFGLVGVSERMARFPAAAAGAALPLSALLFRDRLDDAETVAFAVILAFQPLLLYYSRFLRGDVPLALFGLAFVGFALRAWDRGSRRDAYAAAIVLPLAASASGFVAGYLLCWLLAWALVIEQRSVAADRGRGVRTTLRRLRRRLAGTSTPAARAGLLATGVTVLLFAPRSGSTDGVGLFDPTTVHLAIYEGTVGALRRFVGVRIVHRGPEGTHAFLPYLGDAVGLLTSLATPILLLGIATTLWARYSTRRRSLVEGFGYWGLAALVIVPTIAEVTAPWTLVHVVVPLALPAAVGLVAILRRGTAAGRGSPDTEGTLTDIDAGTVVAVVLVLVALVAQTGAVTAGVYGPSDRSTELAQYAQPADDLTPVAAAIDSASDGDPSTVEVVYVGSSYVLPNEARARSPPVNDEWGNRLPLPWYVESAGATTASTQTPSTFERSYSNNPPPIVVATPDHRDDLEQQLGGDYSASAYRLGLWNREVVIFVADAATD